MDHTGAVFNTLASAQAYAVAAGIARYTRIIYTDRETTEMRGRGGWWTANIAREHFYMDQDTAARRCYVRIREGKDFCLQTVWTDETSNSPNAR